MVSSLGGFLAGAVGGGVIGGAVVRLILDDNAYDQKMGQVQTKTQAASSTMGAGLNRMSLVGTAAFTAIGAAAIAGAAAVVNAASDLGESMNKARVTFGEAADDVVAFSETTASSLGISQAAALEAASGFGAMVQTAGLSEQAAADMSIKMVTLAADMASFNNQDPSEMLERLRAGLAGEAEPLRQFSVLLSAARVNQEAYRSGIAEVGTELTEGQKIQARYNVIMQDTTKQQGDFARTIGESLPGQIRVMKAELTDLSADFGQVLLPVILDVVKVLIALGPVLQVVAANLGIVLATLAGFVAFVYVPKLLFQIALGLQATGGAAAKAAGGVDAAGASIAAIPVPAAAAALALTAIAIAIVDANNGIAEFVVSNEELMGALDALIVSEMAVMEAEAAAKAEKERLTAATDRHTEALAGNIDALREQRDMYLALVDPVFAVINAVREDQEAEEALEEARRKLDRMTEQGKQGTRAYAEAQREADEAALNAAKSHAGLLGAVADLQNEIAEGETTRKDAIRSLREMAASAGLSKDETRLLVDELRAGKNALDAWNRTPLDSKSATVTFNIVEARTSKQGGLAAGGIIAGASGFIARGPTYLVGEGSYATPFGRGAEGVIPLTPEVLREIGRGIVQEMGGMGRMTVVPVVFSDQLDRRVLAAISNAGRIRGSR
jgi:hypothetical protein